jgi:hypothetical protein
MLANSYLQFAEMQAEEGRLTRAQPLPTGRDMGSA